MKKELLKIFVVLITIMVSCSKDDSTTPGNTAPVVKTQSFTVTEALNSNGIVGKVLATDADDDELAFTITANSGTLFTIDDSGTIKLAQNEQLDFETAPSHKINIEVSDGKAKASAEITINVTDVNENTAPEINDITFEVAEDVDDAFIIGTVTATDAENQTLEFSLVNPTVYNSLFEIETSGELSLASGKSLDYETATEYTIEVKVTDGQDEATATVTINVTDVNETVASVIEWQNALGGTGVDEALDAQQTTDGGFILVGSTLSNNGDVTNNNGSSDFWVVKLGASGDLEWQKTLGGSGADIARAVEQTSDGGYIVSGGTQSSDGDVTGYHGNEDFWIVKLDSNGDIEWQKALGGTASDGSNAINQTPDGGFIAVGYTSSVNGDVTENNGNRDVWAVKLNTTGDLQWQKTLGGSGVESALDLQVTSDNGCAIAGYTYSANGDVSTNQGDADLWVVKLNENGNLQWGNTYGGSGLDQAQSIKQTNDDGFIVVGVTASNNGDVNNNNGANDFWVLKINNTGVLQWESTYGGSNNDFARNAQETSDGGFIITGETNSNNGDIQQNNGLNDFWVIKIDDNGEMLWESTYGGSGDDTPFSILQTTDSGFLVTGHSNSNGGDVTGNHGLSDYWVVKLKP